MITAANNLFSIRTRITGLFYLRFPEEDSGSPAGAEVPSRRFSPRRGTSAHRRRGTRAGTCFCHATMKPK
jgi:hypothetical protein